MENYLPAIVHKISVSCCHTHKTFISEKVISMTTQKMSVFLRLTANTVWYVLGASPFPKSFVHISKSICTNMYMYLYIHVYTSAWYNFQFRVATFELLHSTQGKTTLMLTEKSEETQFAQISLSQY